MIAMALACDPKLLIADEPTTALDVTIQRQILALLKDLQQRLGMAVILITHDLGVIAEVTDRVLVLYGGLVMETAPVRDLFARPAHPYTVGLLGAVPDLRDDTHRRLTPIPGSPPNMLSPPPGCPFAPRCPHAMAQCIAALPPLFGEGHSRAAGCSIPRAPRVDAVHEAGGMTEALLTLRNLHKHFHLPGPLFGEMPAAARGRRRRPRGEQGRDAGAGGGVGVREIDPGAHHHPPPEPTSGSIVFDR